MRIKFVKEWRVYQPGEITSQVPPGVADLLIRRGIAVAAPLPTKKK